MDPWVCCFHAQQAAEKALKAVLVAQGAEPPFIHNLVALQALMPPDLDLSTPVTELADLSASARGPRYVTDADGAEDPTWDEAEQAVVTAGRVLAAVRTYLGRSAMTNPAGSTRDASQLAARDDRRATVSGRCPDSGGGHQQATRTRPAPARPSAKWASRTRHRAGIPRSISAMTSGQASRVDVNRARTLFDGMSRSEYPVASSIRMSKPSGNRGPFARVARLKSNSTRSRSGSSSYVCISFALRGAPCGNDSRRLGAVRTRGGQLAARTPAGATSNCSPDLATDTSRRPDPTCPRSPLAPCQSRTRHLAGIPRPTSERTAGQASKVDAKCPTTLFDGIRRSEYPTAPSTRISSPSPGRRAYRPSSPELKSYSGNMPTSASFVRISFALRGAPCGNDSRAGLAVRGYHDEEAIKIGPTDGSPPVLDARMFEVGDRSRQPVVHGRLRFEERHSVHADVLGILPGIPVVLEHTPDHTHRPSPASYQG